MACEYHDGQMAEIHAALKAGRLSIEEAKAELYTIQKECDNE